MYLRLAGDIDDIGHRHAERRRQLAEDRNAGVGGPFFDLYQHPLADAGPAG